MRKQTIILDLSVVCHQLHHNLLSAQVEKEHYQGWLKAQMAWVMSGEWLGSLQAEDSQVILVCDTKPYWRVEYLTRPEVVVAIDRPRKGSRNMAALRDIRAILADPEERPTGQILKDLQTEHDHLLETLVVHYKAGRKLPEASFTKLKGEIQKLVASQKWRSIREPGYEADDLAAALVMVNRSLPEADRNQIILGTVDADWMGLVDVQTTWFCLHGWTPRVRNLDNGAVSLNFWCQKRLKKTVDHPEEIWDLKTVQGDKSDNLPPNSPIEVISLVAPPEEHRLWQRPGIRGILRNWLLNHGDPAVSPVKIAGATAHLRSLGVRRVIRPFDPDSDIYYPRSAA